MRSTVRGHRRWKAFWQPDRPAELAASARSRRTVLLGAHRRRIVGQLRSRDEFWNHPNTLCSKNIWFQGALWNGRWHQPADAPGSTATADPRRRPESRRRAENPHGMQSGNRPGRRSALTERDRLQRKKFRRCAGRTASASSSCPVGRAQDRCCSPPEQHQAASWRPSCTGASDGTSREMAWNTCSNVTGFVYGVARTTSTVGIYRRPHLRRRGHRNRISRLLVGRVEKAAVATSAFLLGSADFYVQREWAGVSPRRTCNHGQPGTSSTRTPPDPSEPPAAVARPRRMRGPLGAPNEPLSGIWRSLGHMAARTAMPAKFTGWAQGCVGLGQSVTSLQSRHLGTIWPPSHYGGLMGFRGNHPDVEIPSVPVRRLPLSVPSPTGPGSGRPRGLKSRFRRPPIVR